MRMFKEGVNQASGMSHMKNKKPVRVIAIASGKGGVGKSTTSINLAISIKNLGFNVGILDEVSENRSCSSRSGISCLIVEWY